MSSQQSAVTALLSALRQTSSESVEHSWRVARMLVVFGHAVSASAIHDERGAMSAILSEQLLLGGLVHDVGKLCVPHEILGKPGRLTECERRVMEQHVGWGEAIVNDCTAIMTALPIVSCHHEHWSGNGYPYGLSKRAIPLTARMAAICDCYDSITRTRCYRPGASIDHARDILSREAGRQFDPQLAEIFLGLPADDLALAGELPDAQTALDLRGIGLAA